MYPALDRHANGMPLLRVVLSPRKLCNRFNKSFRGAVQVFTP